MKRGMTLDSKETQTFVIEDGVVRCMYSEKGAVDLASIGVIRKAKKVSDVSYNAKLQLWEAVDRKTGKVVARDGSRKECVRKEHQHYDSGISRGRLPWKR
jgi:hypothetical protein